MPEDAPRPRSTGARLPVGNNGGLSSEVLRARIQPATTTATPQARTAAANKSGGSKKAKKSSRPTLRMGSRGHNVKLLQRRLRQLGFKPGPVDGIYGPKTLAAVKRYQRARRIAADGIVGPITWAKLGKSGQSKAPGGSGKANRGSGPTLRRGARGPAVNALQRRLQKLGFKPGGVDGIFGPKTLAAVKRFQRAKGLVADGIVGPKTWGKLGITVKTNGSGSAGGISTGSSNSAKLAYAKQRAVALGLRITSTTGGRHVPGSYHYKGRAIDVAGSPSAMAAFYREMAKLSPTECFYDPIGGIKHGQNIGAIGGHSDHVHVAF